MKRLIAIVPSLFLAACHHQEAKLEKPITPVRVSAVDTYEPKSGGRYSASIQPGRQVSLAFRVPGFITSLHMVGGRPLEPGDMVAEGTILAQLRQEDYKNSTAQAQSQVDSARESLKSASAQLAQAQAARTKAEADFARAKTLIESQSLTQPPICHDAARFGLSTSARSINAAPSSNSPITCARANPAWLSEKASSLPSRIASRASRSVSQRSLSGSAASPSTLREQ